MAPISVAISATKRFDSMIFRPAAIADLAAIVTIYNHYVVNDHATLDTQEHTVSDRNEWFARFANGTAYQCWVGEDRAAEVVGYSVSTPFRRGSPYDGSVETTIYLSPDVCGRGIGFELYQRFFEVLNQVTHLHRAYAAVAQPNPAANALHQKLGFRAIGTQSEVGYKFERYWDLTWFERKLVSTD